MDLNPYSSPAFYYVPAKKSTSIWAKSVGGGSLIVGVTLISVGIYHRMPITVVAGLFWAAAGMTGVTGGFTRASFWTRISIAGFMLLAFCIGTFNLEASRHLPAWQHREGYLFSQVMAYGSFAGFGLFFFGLVGLAIVFLRARS